MSGSLSISGSLTVQGVLNSSGAFGQLSGQAASGLAMATGGTYYQIVGFNTGSLTGSNMTVSTTNNNLVIREAGLYIVMAQISFHATADTYTFALFQNGVINPDAISQQTMTNGTQIQEATITDPDFYQVGDTIDVRVTGATNTDTLTMNYGTLWAVRVMGVPG
jgi:hypothetical protein